MVSYGRIQGRCQDFSQGGHTESNIIVMAFSPRNIVGCFLTKAGGGGHGHPRTPLATPLVFSPTSSPGKSALGTRLYFPFIYFSLLSPSFSCRTGFYFGRFAALASQRRALVNNLSN